MCENVRGKNDNELLVTRPDQFKKAINVIHVYGQQECRIGKEGTERHWNEILDVINKVEARNELLLLIEDFNRHLPNVPSENSRSSYGGELIDELLQSGKYVLINKTDKVIGGPWTRLDPATGTKSVLHLVITSSELVKHVDSLEIDNKRRFTTFKKKGKTLSFPDHYGIVVKFSGIPRKRLENKKKE